MLEDTNSLDASQGYDDIAIHPSYTTESKGILRGGSDGLYSST